MTGTPRVTFASVVLDSPDARVLAAFYRQLLGWTVEQDEPNWVKLSRPAADQGCRFRPRRLTSGRPGRLVPAISR